MERDTGEIIMEEYKGWCLTAQGLSEGLGSVGDEELYCPGCTPAWR